MTKTLEGKIALVTGGNSGIGLATAKRFHDAGAKVVITARSPQTFEQAKKEFGEIFDIQRTDVAKISELQALASHIQKTHKKLDVIFANAGIAEFVPLEALTEESFDRQFNINVKGVLFTVQKMLPLLSKPSSIVINSSSVGIKGMANASAYAATKAAARSLARCLSAELIDRGIRVNAIAPGPIHTPIFSRMGMSKAQIDGFSQQIIAMNPSKRFGEAEEVADAVLFLASDASQYIVGTELAIDGGYSQV